MEPNSGILDIFNNLAATSSRKEKEAILSLHSENILLKNVAFRTYNPRTNYYIRMVPEFTNTKLLGISLSLALDGLSDLSARTITGGAAQEHLRRILEAVCAEDAEVVARVIDRDWNVGIGIGTINKVWPKLIPEYPVMLCATLNEKTQKHLKFPCIVNVKEDGLRVNARLIDNKVEYRTRNGNIIDCGHPALDEQCTSIIKSIHFEMILDGELIAYDSGTTNLSSRKESNGLGTKAVRGTITAAEKARFGMVVWDFIPTVVFFGVAGAVSPSYATKFDVLKSLPQFDPMNHTSNQVVELVQSWEVNSLEEIYKLFDLVHSSGQEGLIVKNKHLIWTPTRSKDCLKVKSENTIDLVVVGYQLGSLGSKYETMVGALILEDASGRLKVEAGSGLTDDDRMVPPPIGSIVEILYNEPIQNKKSSNWSLFLPRFVKSRPDKNTPDTFGEVK